MPRYIADGSLRRESPQRLDRREHVTLHQGRELHLRESTLTPSRWVLCVRDDSPVKPRGLEGKRIATEIVEFVKRVLAERKVNAEVEFSWARPGKVAEELSKPPSMYETGSSLRRQRT